jgi:hypothetical protein
MVVRFLLSRIRYRQSVNMENLDPSHVSRYSSSEMQCVKYVKRNQPVELEIFWTSPSLTRKLSLFDHHVAEGEESVSTYKRHNTGVDSLWMRTTTVSIKLDVTCRMRVGVLKKRRLLGAKKI